jgi:hypothetical protein
MQVDEKAGDASAEPEEKVAGRHAKVSNSARVLPSCIVRAH